MSTWVSDQPQHPTWCTRDIPLVHTNNYSSSGNTNNHDRLCYHCSSDHSSYSDFIRFTCDIIRLAHDVICPTHHQSIIHRPYLRCVGDFWEQHHGPIYSLVDFRYHCQYRIYRITGDCIFDPHNGFKLLHNWDFWPFYYWDFRFIRDIQFSRFCYNNWESGILGNH